MKNLLTTSHGRLSTRRWGQVNTMSDRDMAVVVGLPREEALAVTSRRPMLPVTTCQSVTINGIGTAVYGKDGHMEVFLCPEATGFQAAEDVSDGTACHYTSDALPAYTHPDAPGAVILVNATRPLDPAAERCVRVAWQAMTAAPDVHRDLYPLYLTETMGRWSASVTCLCGDRVGCDETAAEVTLSHYNGDTLRLASAAVATFYRSTTHKSRFNHCRPYGAASVATAATLT